MFVAGSLAFARLKPRAPIVRKLRAPIVRKLRAPVVRDLALVGGVAVGSEARVRATIQPPLDVAAYWPAVQVSAMILPDSTRRASIELSGLEAGVDAAADDFSIVPVNASFLPTCGVSADGFAIKR